MGIDAMYAERCTALERDSNESTEVDVWRAQSMGNLQERVLEMADAELLHLPSCRAERRDTEHGTHATDPARSGTERGHWSALRSSPCAVHDRTELLAVELGGETRSIPSLGVCQALFSITVL